MGPQMSPCTSSLGLVSSSGRATKRATWHLAGAQDIFVLFPLQLWGSLRQLHFLQTCNDLLREHVGQNPHKLGLSQERVCRGQALWRKGGERGRLRQEGEGSVAMVLGKGPSVLQLRAIPG